MSITNAIASVPIKDMSCAVQWYEKLLGRPADSMPTAELAEWKFERGGWLQLYQNPERAGTGSVTLAVSSLGEQIADFEKRGINNGHRGANDQVMTLMITDPNGNHIAFAEAIDKSVAH